MWVDGVFCIAVR